MSNEKKKDDSLELSAGYSPEGGAQAKVRIGSVQRVLGFASPERAARAELTNALANSASRKLAEGKELTEPEDALVGYLLRKELEALRRRADIEESAEAAFPLMRKRLLPPAVTTGEPDKTQQADGDWLRRFWADAELIDDEAMREIYARILAGERAHPGSFSRAALAVLRDLDAGVARLFAILRNLAIGPFLPRTGEPKQYIEDMGLDFGARMQLADAGLLRDKEDVTYVIEAGENRVFRCGEKLLFFGTEEKQTLVFECYSLTTAANELLAIADVKHDEKYFELVLPWIAGHGCVVGWAVPPTPAPLSGDDLRRLEWIEWTPSSPDRGSTPKQGEPEGGGSLDP